MSANWTKVPNAYWEVEADLSPAEQRLLLRLVRLTNGFHQEWAEVSESDLIDLVGLSRAALYRAKSGLEGKGLIEVARDRNACCYRLSGELAGEQRGGLKNETPCPRKGSQKRDGGSQKVDPRDLTDETVRGPKNETPCILKETRSKERLKETSSIELIVQTADDDFLKSEKDEPPALKAEPELVDGLVAAGVDLRMAQRFAAESPELAKRELEALPHRGAVANPAGYLVAAIKSGGFGLPGAIVARESREAVHQKRREQRRREEHQAEQGTMAALAEWDRLVAAASAEQLREAEAYARSQFGRHPQMRDAPVEAPHIRGLMLSWLRERIQLRPGRMLA